VSYSVTEHVQEAAEDVSVWTVMNATRRRRGILCDSGAGYKCHDLLTYLLSDKVKNSKKKQVYTLLATNLAHSAQSAHLVSLHFQNL